MIEHPYILQPYTGRNSRHTCPECGKTNQFSRYISAESGEIVSENVGRCNRIDKCGYHYTPKQYFTDNKLLSPSPLFSRGDAQRAEGLTPPHITLSVAEGPTYIAPQIFNASLKNYKNNNLIIYLNTLFNTEQVNHLIKLYNIGTSSRWKGGTTIFWQIDTKDRIRTGKLIKYNPSTGKRIKNLTNWVHSVLKLENFNLKQCLFGEHLLTQFPDKTVAIVESEKTAIIASVFLPDLIWLASGGAENLSKEKLRPLMRRNVILFPDASKHGSIYQKWKEKGKQFGFETSDFLEQYTSEEQKADGLDIADFLVSENKTQAVVVNEPVPELQAIEYNGTTPQIPYNTPSPVAVIDSKINTGKIFKAEELVVKSRIFTSVSGDKIELVGLRDYGFCKNWESHKKQNGYCRACLLNCIHTIRINGKLQQREYTQLEILLMQESSVTLPFRAGSTPPSPLFSRGDVRQLPDRGVVSTYYTSPPTPSPFHQFASANSLAPKPQPPLPFQKFD